MTENEIEVIENNNENQSIGPILAAQRLLQAGVNIDSLKEMILLQERWESTQARKAYHLAMTAFKKNPPVIEKDKKVNYASSKGPNINYRHASLANVTEKINSALSQHGLSATWDISNNKDLVEVTCKITHCDGHSEQTKICAPIDVGGSKNSIQSIGSTISYLQRYTLLSLTGLAAQDGDDDGRGSERISEEEVANLKTELESLGVDIELFLKFMKVDRLENISKVDYPKAINSISAKRNSIKK